MKIIFGVMTPILLSLGSGALGAAPQQWRITETAGDVRLVDGGRARPATRGALLSSGSMIATGANSRAVIVRGQEYVVVSPRSRLRVPLAAESRGGLMQMIADFGTSMFKIEKKSMPHFGVQTPYMVALVKGTTFTVSVGPDGGSVQVTEGAVQVSTLDGGASELVRPGDIATVAASDLYQLTIEGDVNKVVRSEGAPAGVVTSSVSAPAPVADTAAPVILAAGATQPAYDGPPAEDVVVTSAVAAEPSSLSELTDGLLEDSATELAMALLGQQAREAGAVPAASPAPEPGVPASDPVSDEPGQGSGKGDSGEGGGPAPENGDAPATPAGGSDEDEGGASTPGAGAPGNSDDGDKPGQGSDDGDKPSHGDDEGDKPGQGDDKPDKPDKGADDGDKPGKGGDDGDKPGKGDDDRRQARQGRRRRRQARQGRRRRREARQRRRRRRRARQGR
jgi:hypothetical protein